MLRNTPPLVEAAFNVLYRRFAESKDGVPTKEFGDIATLEEKGLIEDRGDRYEVRFAVRDGMPPRLTISPSPTRRGFPWSRGCGGWSRTSMSGPRTSWCWPTHGGGSRPWPGRSDRREYRRS